MLPIFVAILANTGSKICFFLVLTSWPAYIYLYRMFLIPSLTKRKTAFRGRPGSGFLYTREAANGASKWKPRKLKLPVDH